MADNIGGENDNIPVDFTYHASDRGEKHLICQCVHCGKNTVKDATRQRQHLLDGCPVLHPSSNNPSSDQKLGQPQASHDVQPGDAVDPAWDPSQRPSSGPQVALSVSAGGSSRSSQADTPLHLIDPRIVSLDAHEGNETTLGKMEAVRSSSALLREARPALPSDADDSHSTDHQSATAQNRSHSSHSSEPQYRYTPIQPKPSPWMLHHEARTLDFLPEPSINGSAVKIESVSSNSDVLSTLRSLRTEDPLASIEIDDDDEESEQDQSSDESDSESNTGSVEYSDEDVDSRPGGAVFSDDDDFENVPFEEEEDEETDDDVNENAHGRSILTGAADGHFGPNAIHKRRRVYKRGKRGPAKHEKPDPEFIALQNEAMRVFIEEQNNTKAMRLVQQAIGVNPEFYSAHALLAEIYFAQGEDQQAINALYLGAHAAPRDPDIWQGVADACLRLTTVDRDTALRQALNCFRRILDVDEGNHDALFQRAAIYHEMGNLNRALREYENLLKVMPYNTSIIRQQAPLLQELGRVDEAIKVCEDSIAHGKGGGDGAEDEFSWPDIIVYTDIFAGRDQVDEAIFHLKRLSRWLVNRETEDYWDEVVDDDREWDTEHEPRRIEAEGFDPQLFPTELYGQALPFELRVKLGLYRLRQGLHSRMEAFGHFEWLTPDDLSEGAPVYTHRELFLDIAKALKDAKEHQDSLRYYEALMATEAYSDASFWLQIAATSYICNKKEQSRSCYEAAKAADRNCVEARTQLSILYAELGDKTTALQNAEEAVEMTTRGIEKSDRRKYEKKDQKIARRAAESVLKMARRLGRLPKKRARRPRDPAKLRRNKITRDANSQQLATKIEKQKTIHERREAKKKKLAELSDDQRTSKVKLLYSHLTEATPGMRNGNPGARTAWMNFAQQMVEDFCSTEALFPPDRHMNFQGYDKEAIRKSQARLYLKQQSSGPPHEDEQADGIATAQVDNAHEDCVPTEYRTIPFSSWLDIFLEFALLHAKSGLQWKEACYAVLRSAHDCTVWYHDKAAMVQIYSCYFICALELHDEYTMFFTVGRWFLKEYQFCTDVYRLFAAMNLFYTDAGGGIPLASQSVFRDPPTQKFMLRQMGALDARLPEDYNIDGEEGLIPQFMRTTFAAGGNNVPEDEEQEQFIEKVKPKEMDVVLLCLYAHILYAGDTFVSALNYFYRALTLEPKNPMVLLSIALCYVHELAKRGVEDRHMHVLNVIAVFDEYAEARLEQATGKGDKIVTAVKREIAFNRARLWHMLGLSDLAIREYNKVLEPVAPEEPDEESKNCSMEAALATATIYVSNGDEAVAKYITERWLVIE